MMLHDKICIPPCVWCQAGVYGQTTNPAQVPPGWAYTAAAAVHKAVHHHSPADLLTGNSTYTATLWGCPDCQTFPAPAKEIIRSLLWFLYFKKNLNEMQHKSAYNIILRKTCKSDEEFVF